MTELSHKIFTQSANNPHLIVLKPFLVCFRSEKNVIMRGNQSWEKDINYCSPF